MADAYPISLVYRDQKGAALTAPEVDGNFRALVEAIQRLAVQGPGAGIDRIEQDPDTGVATLYALNVVLGTLTMPPRPVRPMGLWTAGAAYAIGDLVRIEASATVPRALIGYCASAFKSDATDPANDIVAGRIQPLVYDGKPAQTLRGTFDVSVTYAVGDVVRTDNGVYYQLYQAAPAGSVPGQPQMQANGSPVVVNGNLVFPWGQLTLQFMTPFRFATVGKPAASALLFKAMADRAGYIGANQAGASAKLSSLVKAGTAPAAAVTLTLALNGTTIGTVMFAAGKTVPTYTTTGGNPVLVNLGDVLTLTAPASQDSALADLVGYIALQ